MLIEYIGEHQVYDLIVLDMYNFVVNDVFVYNIVLVLNMVQYVVLYVNWVVGIYLLEMFCEQLVMWMLCFEVWVDNVKVWIGYLGEWDFFCLVMVVSWLLEVSIFIDDMFVQNVLEM